MNARCFGALSLALAASAACSASDATERNPIVDDVSFSAEDAESLDMAAELSFRHLYEHDGTLLDGVDEIWAERVDIDSMGMAHTRIVQTIDGIPVLGGEAIVHIAANGEIARVTDGLIRHLTVDTQVVYDREASIDIAVQAFGRGDLLTDEPEATLLAFRHEDVDHLAWRVQLRQLDGTHDSTMPLYFIDAHTGDVILHYENMHTQRTGTSSAAKELKDNDKRTLDMKSGTNYDGAKLATSADAIALQAHRNAGHSLAYFADRHDRNSYDGRGAPVISYVHYGNNYVNAFWDGRRLTYGDGDGRISRPLTVLDVVAHEFAHAVTSNSAQLIYYGESGALNEATSDIMAAAVEAYVVGRVDANTWKIGEDCWLAGEALRFMNNPAADGSSSEHYSTRYTGTGDNAGVHINSGIGNLFFYLLSEGGRHPNPTHRVATVQGIGIDAAADIWYRALTRYMTARTDFAGARAATLSATADIFGAHSNEHCQVKNAWAEVGVGTACETPVSDRPPASDTVLQNAVPRRVSGNAGRMQYFTIEVPAGARDLRIGITGGRGDADLYVKLGSKPTLSSFDCRPYRAGNNETCTASAPRAGTYHIGLLGYAGFEGVVLEARYTDTRRRR